MRSETVEKRLRVLSKDIRRGEWDYVDTEKRFNRASFLIDNDPPKQINWNYLNGKNWSQKWLISISLGPWRQGRARDVMEKVQNRLGRRPLHRLRRSDRLPFP